jgi:hypothetical protein
MQVGWGVGGVERPAHGSQVRRHSRHLSLSAEGGLTILLKDTGYLFSRTLEAWGCASMSYIFGRILSVIFFSASENLFDSLIDYICISGTMQRNVLEYVDHSHKHFVTPCSVNTKGRYNVPTNPKEGYRMSSGPGYAVMLDN